jgi:peptidyl-prolyl cis-trans isomerase B (cyclophilin B)
VASKRQRQREIARNAYERRLQRRAERERRAQQWSVGAIVAVLVIGVGIGSAALTGVFNATAKAKPTTVSCVYTKSGTAARKVSLPPGKTDPDTSYKATIATNRGNVVIDLLDSKAPCTVNSFVSLADQKYFNSSPCHRLTTTGIYVLQCGDPTGTGRGGPGYVFNNENLAGAKYPAGTVAMANTGAADSNGSQFFLVYKNSPLPASYTPFGTIVSGLNVIQNVAKAGSDNSNAKGDGHPKEKVEIESLTIKKT